MISPVVEIIKDSKEVKWVKMNTRVVYVLSVKVKDMEEKNREVKTKRMGKELVGSVQASKRFY